MNAQILQAAEYGATYNYPFHTRMTAITTNLIAYATQASFTSAAVHPFC